MTDQEADYVLVKYIIVGDSSTGKSSLASCYTIYDYKLTGDRPTIGVDFYFMTIPNPSKKYPIQTSKNLKIHIWDTAGQEKFRSITHHYYKGANGAIITFSMTDKSSFESIDGFIEDINRLTNNIPIIIVGTFNDVDRDYHAITDEEINKKSNKYGIKIFKVSCLTKDGIDEAFDELNMQTTKNIKESAVESKPVYLGIERKDRKSYCCG